MLPDIFLAFSHATLISLFPASFPKHGSSTLAGFSQVSKATVPERDGMNQKTELTQEVGPRGPKELVPTFACGAGMSWKAAPRPACRQRLAPARWLQACSAHRQAQNSADFLGPRHKPHLGTGFKLCCLQRQTGAQCLGSWSCFHKAWREQETSSWLCLWVGSVSWEPALHARKNWQDSRTGCWLVLLEESYGN